MTDKELYILKVYDVSFPEKQGLYNDLYVIVNIFTCEQSSWGVANI